MKKFTTSQVSFICLLPAWDFSIPKTIPHSILNSLFVLFSRELYGYLDIFQYSSFNNSNIRQQISLKMSNMKQLKIFNPRQVVFWYQSHKWLTGIKCEREKGKNVKIIRNIVLHSSQEFFNIVLIPHTKDQ